MYAEQIYFFNAMNRNELTALPRYQMVEVVTRNMKPFSEAVHGFKTIKTVNISKNASSGM
jgi:hypothetical protein